MLKLIKNMRRKEKEMALLCLVFVVGGGGFFFTPPAPRRSISTIDRHDSGRNRRITPDSR